MDKEIATQLKLTERLIAREGIDIVLHREGDRWEDDGEGGRKLIGGPLDRPPVRRWFHVWRPDPTMFIDTKGDRTMEKWSLVGLPTDDMQKGDSFTVNGVQYTIRRVMPDRSYETRAEVVLFAT